jgi:hypothetical protein
MRRGRATLVAAAVAAGLLIVSCGRETPGTGPIATTPGTVTQTVTQTRTASESPEPEETSGALGLPPPVTPTHGGEYYGVYLAAAPFGATELDEAVRRLDRLGIEAFPGDINCDEGAADRLDLPNDLAVVAVYFDRPSDAKAWLDRLEPPPLGLARVRTFCLD